MLLLKGFDFSKINKDKVISVVDDKNQQLIFQCIYDFFYVCTLNYFLINHNITLHLKSELLTLVEPDPSYVTYNTHANHSFKCTKMYVRLQDIDVHELF